MPARMLTAAFCLTLVGVAAWLRSSAQTHPVPRWTEVAPGILRSPGVPAGYALVANGQALLIDAPHPADGLPAVATVLLTHYHRDSVRAVGALSASSSARRTSPMSRQRRCTSFCRHRRSNLLMCGGVSAGSRFQSGSVRRTAAMA